MKNTTIKYRNLLFLCIFILSGCGTRGDIEKYAIEAFNEIDGEIGAKPAGYRTVLLPFTGYTSPTSGKLEQYESEANEDERFFAGSLSDQFVASEKFRVYTRSKLTHALKELELQNNDIFDPDTAKKLGQFIGADLMVLLDGYIGRGTTHPGNPYGVNFQGVFRVKIIVIDVETAEIKGLWQKGS